MPNQEPESVWIFGNSSVRVGTQGLFCPYLKTFVPPFLLTKLTAPGSPRKRQCTLNFFMIYYMATIVRGLWLAAKRALFLVMTGNYYSLNKNSWDTSTQRCFFFLLLVRLLVPSMLFIAVNSPNVTPIRFSSWLVRFKLFLMHVLRFF